MARPEPLDLVDEEEIDISDSLSSGLSLLSTASEDEFSTPTKKRTTVFTDLPAQPTTPTPRSVLLSPSSPNLLDKVSRPRGLSRSHTLPHLPQLKTRRRLSEIEGLDAHSENIQRWILGIAIVDFDLDEGPVISGIYPPLILFPEESENIAFCSFPDSVQFDQGSQTHSFRMREYSAPVTSEKRPATQDGFIYGYSHFTQRRDANIKRGYSQRSVVILSQYQYPAFFTSLASIFGPLFQKHGKPMLEAACHNIGAWPAPVAGETFELGFLGSVIRVEIPRTVDEQQVVHHVKSVGYDPTIHILASAAPSAPPPILLFEASLPSIWSIWECLVLCEPILIFGLSPAQTSQAVWWLRDLIRPIPAAGDVRPYFTIHDADHAALVNRLPPKSGLLLGVTNPFFERSCAHWPHVLSLGKRLPPNTATRSASAASPSGPTPGWKTKVHKRYTSKDRVLLKQLEEACRKGTEQDRYTASAALHRHFTSRSSELLIPLSRYLHTLIPTPAEIAASSSSTSLRMKPFNTGHFLDMLGSGSGGLPFRSTGKRKQFYERWLRTPAFGLWLAQQETIVHGVLKGG